MPKTENGKTVRLVLMSVDVPKLLLRSREKQKQKNCKAGRSVRRRAKSSPSTCQKLKNCTAGPSASSRFAGRLLFGWAGVAWRKARWAYNPRVPGSIPPRRVLPAAAALGLGETCPSTCQSGKYFESPFIFWNSAFVC